MIQSCLESELKYIEKEKSLLNDEIRELTRQVASFQQNQNSIFRNNVDLEAKSLPQAQIPIDSYRKPDSSQKPTNAIVSSPKVQRKRSSNIRFAGEVSTTNIRKREHDFDSIMNFVRERGNAMDCLNNQIEKYNEDFQRLQEEIYQVANEKMELHKAYEELMDEHRALLKERQSYEGILNLILKEKKGTEESIHQILETLINKLNAIAAEEGTNSRFTVLESALHAVQGQNSQYREEITELKCKLNTVEQNHLVIRSELESALTRSRTEAEQLRTSLQSRNDECGATQRLHLEKLAKLQELHDSAVSAKVKKHAFYSSFACLLLNSIQADVEKTLAEKEIELAKQQSAMETLQKQNFKQQKKVQELQKTNIKLLRDLQDHKKNVLPRPLAIS